MALCFSHSALAEGTYRVTVEVFSLGELIGNPMMVVEEGKTTAGNYSEANSAQYKFVVLVREAGDDQVSISLQFSSGKINLQPNLLVDLSKQASVTIKKTRMTVLVEKLPPTRQADGINESAVTYNQ